VQQKGKRLGVQQGTREKGHAFLDPRREGKREIRGGASVKKGRKAQWKKRDVLRTKLDRERPLRPTEERRRLYSQSLGKGRSLRGGAVPRRER